MNFVCNNALICVQRLPQEHSEVSQRKPAETVGVSGDERQHVLNARIVNTFVKLGNFKAVEDKFRFAYVPTLKRFCPEGSIDASSFGSEDVINRTLRSEFLSPDPHREISHTE